MTDKRWERLSKTLLGGYAALMLTNVLRLEQTAFAEIQLTGMDHHQGEPTYAQE